MTNDQPSCKASPEGMLPFLSNYDCCMKISSRVKGQGDLGDEAAAVGSPERQALRGAVHLLETRAGIAQADAFGEVGGSVAAEAGAVVAHTQAELFALAPGPHFEAAPPVGLTDAVLDGVLDQGL